MKRTIRIFHAYNVGGNIHLFKDDFNEYNTLPKVDEVEFGDIVYDHYSKVRHRIACRLNLGGGGSFYVTFSDHGWISLYIPGFRFGNIKGTPLAPLADAIPGNDLYSAVLVDTLGNEYLLLPTFRSDFKFELFLITPALKAILKSFIPTIENKTDRSTAPSLSAIKAISATTANAHLLRDAIQSPPCGGIKGGFSLVGGLRGTHPARAPAS